MRNSELDREETTSPYIVRDVPLLTSVQECGLAYRIRAGDEDARQSLTEHNLKLVIHVAKYYARDTVALDDVIQDGMIGLMNAVTHFDPDKLNPKNGKPYRFSTVATWWIRQSITRHLPDYQNAVRLPVYMNTEIGRVVRMSVRLTAELEHEPTPAELAEALHKEVAEVEWLLALHQTAYSLDAPLDNDREHDNTLADVLIAPENVEAESAAEQDELITLIARTLSVLTEKEQRILTLRKGLDGGRPQTLSEVAKQYGVTRERIRQIEEQALRKVTPRLRVIHREWMEEAS